jgi:hypothetical protein
VKTGQQKSIKMFISTTNFPGAIVKKPKTVTFAALQSNTEE